MLVSIKKRNAPSVFIGRSPITKSKDLSVVADYYEKDGEVFLIAAVGPKWMDYEKNIKFFKYLRDEICG